MNKYEVGQKVRIKEDIEVCTRSSHDTFFAIEMAKYKGKIVTIKETNVFNEEYSYYLDIDTSEYIWDEEWLEPVNIVETKKDLKDGDIVTLGNGERLLLSGRDFKDFDEDAKNLIADLDDLNDDLTFNRDYSEEDNIVVKVERPLTYYEVFNREETAKELTVEEISKLLGYKVKIVKRH